jgi:hypothetical protein
MGLASHARHRVRRARNQAAFTFWSACAAEGRRNREYLLRLKDRYRGRRCFVMGNGPSLLKCDLNLLATEITIVSNAHYLIWDRLTYVPTFLTIEDKLVAQDRAPEIRRLNQITKVLPFDLHSLLGEADANAIYVYFERLHRDFPRFSFDLQRIAYWGGTVSFFNLQLAAYLGCNPIVLIGFDHSYQVPADQIRNHVIVSQQEDVNHIHPDYFGPGYRWHDPNTARMEAAYHCARRELGPAGFRVVNATAGGHLEVFDRVPYDSLFER